MSGLPREGCRHRDARIAELERFHRERMYLRDESRIERDLRPLTGESAAMKVVRLAIQQEWDLIETRRVRTSRHITSARKVDT